MATVLHDAIMNPAEGKIFYMSSPDSLTHVQNVMDSEDLLLLNL